MINVRIDCGWNEIPKSLNENFEKCTMMYRMAMQNGIDSCNNQTILIWLATALFC